MHCTNNTDSNNNVIPEIDSLPNAEMSDNLIFEDQRRSLQQLSRVLHQEASEGPLTRMLALDRGRGQFVNGCSGLKSTRKFL